MGVEGGFVDEVDLCYVFRCAEYGRSVVWPPRIRQAGASHENSTDASYGQDVVANAGSLHKPRVAGISRGISQAML